MLKCTFADKYQALRKPVCDNGRGCEACTAKWLGKLKAVARLGAKIRAAK